MQEARRCTVYGGRGEPDEIVMELDPPESASDSTLRSIMSRDLVCAHADLEILAIVRLVLRHRVGCVPVVDDERRPVGLIENLDLVEQLEATMHALEQGHPLPPELRTTAADLAIAPAPVVILDECEPIASAARAISGEPLHHVLVVSWGKLVGVVASRDIVRWLNDHAAFEPKRRFASGTGVPAWHPLEG